MTAPIDPARSAFSQLAKHVWYWPVLRGVLAVLLGIVAWVWPGITVVVIVLTLGIFAVADGVVEIVNGIRYRAFPGSGWHIVVGLLGLAVGVLLLVWPGKSAEVLAWFIGLWALVTGILQCVAAFALRPVPRSGWGWGLFAGVLGVVFGLLVLFNVTAGLVSIVWLIATWAIVWGIALIVAGFAVRSIGRRAG